jgi:hypothetical protein
MEKTKHKIVKRSVKHVFTPEETAALNVEFGQAYDGVKSAEADFDAVKSVHKAKITEAESKMISLRATINAGFDFREKPLILVMDLKAGKKFFYLESCLIDGEIPQEEQPVITEAVTEQDRQQELIEAEAKFEKREVIKLFEPLKQDFGTLTVGRFEDKWYSSLNVRIGEKTITERLDSEQPCSKKRIDQIRRALKTFAGWVEETLGREEAKGFKNQMELIKTEHAEREE